MVRTLAFAGVPYFCLMHLIESPRLYVRYLTMDDLEDYYRLNGSEEVMRYIRAPKSRIETSVFLQQVIANYNASRPNLRLALMEKGTDTFVGSFAIIPVDNSADTQIGYALLKDYWGKGYATEIVKTGLIYTFNTFRLSHVAAIADIANTASQNVLLKNGFVFEKTVEEENRKLNVYRKENHAFAG